MALAFCLVAGAAAQQPAQSVQQDFEAAAALSAGTDKAAALAAWESLERRVGTNGRSHAIVLVRKSAVLLDLDRKDDAVIAAREGLAGLPANDPSLREDRWNAFYNLGRIAQNAVDYASAAAAYDQAEALAATPTDKLSTLLAIIKTKTFTDPDGAAAAATRAEALLATSKMGNVVRGQFGTAKGVLLLNRGDLPGARAATVAAVKLMGGLTEATDLNDVSARSNAAIALLLSGDTDEARHYMAMTGAGRLSSGKFNPAVEMTPPDCGGEAGLKPADMAVVEFSIADDGSVAAARPIYAAGGGAVALEFARAAGRWSWTAEQVKQMPTFFRYNMRVEMRCNLAFERPSVGAGLAADLARWLNDKGHPVAEQTVGDAIALGGQRAALAKVEAQGQGASLAALSSLVALIDNPVLPREERVGFATRALAIANAADAPVTARLGLDITARTSAKAESYRPGVFRRLVTPMLTEQPYASDPRARAALLLMLADNERGRARDAALALLQQAAALPGLGRDDPLRVGALIRTASFEEDRGNKEAAKAAYAQSGLSADQCALSDNPPKLLHYGGTFPDEARVWGFEGWTRTQFDIAADGKVLNERAIVSYPPFVFTRAGVQTVSGATYAKSYRPAGALGCGASTQGVAFKMG
ncbi:MULTISPECIES: hypothetical protein [unclassified Sphingomonas]|uniref:hypothetical protein n=1 Tax=unclassified Sphingomonas TaxID=196159 RepID=UPI00226A8272|nr:MULTISPECIES: hypothetical protein [unclassified Sphingomonas]